MLRPICVFLLIVCITGLSAAQIKDEWVVVVDAGADGGAIAKTLGVNTKHVYRSALKGFSGKIPKGLLNKVKQHPNVRAVYPNNVVSLITPLAPPPGKGKDKDNGDGGDEEPTGQEIPTGYKRINADLITVPDLSGLRVAIIDTGLQLDHPDLNANSSEGFDAFAAVNNTPGVDLHGHGTHVGGTIGAIDNEIGVIGIAPGVELISVRVLDASGSGSSAGVAAGIDWAADPANGISVANMSLGGGQDDLIDNAVRGAVAAGVTVVVAAGNDNITIDPWVNYPWYSDGLSPASVVEAITVSALTDYDGETGGAGTANKRTVRNYGSDDETANYSNFGTRVDVIAPGTKILSTWIGSGTNAISGTSMATPHVTGLCALYLAGNAGATPADVAAHIKASGTYDYTDTKDDGVQEPLINVADALAPAAGN